MSIIWIHFVPLKGISLKTEPGIEPDANIKEEEKDEKKEKEEKKEKDTIKKEEKDREREKEKERERPTRSSSSSSSSGVKEEREKPGVSSQLEETGGDRLAVIGGSKRKEMEQLKIVRAELKYVYHPSCVVCIVWIF